MRWCFGKKWKKGGKEGKSGKAGLKTGLINNIHNATQSRIGGWGGPKGGRFTRALTEALTSPPSDFELAARLQKVTKSAHSHME